MGIFVSMNDFISMNFLRFLMLILLLPVLHACNKDDFPDEFSIQDTWIEKTDKSFRMEIEFRSQNRAFFKKEEGSIAEELRYRLDKADELLLFLPEEFPDGTRSTHKISYDRKTEELTIYGLLPSIPEEVSKTVFVRK